MDATVIRSRFDEIIAKTKGADRVAPAGWWGRAYADERRVIDDGRAGRHSWRGAHEHAKYGIAELEAGNLQAAEAFLWAATDLYIDALESRIEPKDRDRLSKSAQRRGRPRKGKIIL